jgi:hypothetical protein
VASAGEDGTVRVWQDDRPLEAEPCAAGAPSGPSLRGCLLPSPQRRDTLPTRARFWKNARP